METTRIIVSSCGTSLLTNDSGDFSAQLTETANETAASLPAEVRAAIERRARDIGHELKTSPFRRVRALSAELNGILGIYGGYWPSDARTDYHYLLHTDTFQGAQAAELVAAWLRRQSPPPAVVDPVRLDGLTTRNPVDFHWGMRELVDWCLSTFGGQGHPNLPSPHYRVIFNLVGGFKAVQGYLNTLGMLYADQIVYLFEARTAQLITIPRLPLRLDLSVIERYLPAIRRMAAGLPVQADQAAGVPELLLQDDPSGIQLNEWGRVLWNEAGWEQHGLLDSPSPRVSYGPRFAESVMSARLEPKRLRQVNQRIGDLARHLEGAAGNRSLHRLDLKPIATPLASLAPSTHECDAWADGDAKRLFGHFEGETCVLDRLDDALH